MQDSIYRYAKVGVIHPMAFPETVRGEGPIVETLTCIAADDYFTAVEVTGIKEVSIRQKARDILETSHLTVVFGSQPSLLLNKLNLNSEDPEEREKAVNQVRDSIDQARFLGAELIAVCSGVDPGGSKREIAKGWLIDSLRKVCSYAQSGKKIGVVLETFDRVPFGKNLLIGPTLEAVEIAQEVRKEFPQFGLLIDLSHIPLLGEDISFTLRTVRDYLLHVHLGNCVVKDPQHPAYGDEHPRFGIPGGENDVKELGKFLKQLLDNGYLNPDCPRIMSFEIKPLPGESSEIVIANAKRTLNEAWARL